MPFVASNLGNDQATSVSVVPMCHDDVMGVKAATDYAYWNDKTIGAGVCL
jgi:hypothetical protein